MHAIADGVRSLHLDIPALGPALSPALSLRGRGRYPCRLTQSFQPAPNGPLSLRSGARSQGKRRNVGVSGVPIREQARSYRVPSPLPRSISMISDKLC